MDAVGAVPGHRNGLMPSVLPGSESRARAQSGFPRNVGDPAVSTDQSPGRRYRVTNSRRPPAAALGRGAGETRALSGIARAKETKRGETERQEVIAP